MFRIIYEKNFYSSLVMICLLLCCLIKPHLALFLSNCRGDCGCFPLEYPFSSDFEDRPISVPPECDNAQFFLYTTKNRNNANIIRPFEEHKIRNSYFNSSQNTYIIIHGWFEEGNATWIRRLKDKLLDYEDCNVVAMNWKKAADNIIYIDPASNTRLCGSKLAIFIQTLQKIFCISLNSVFLIGFSLGAHLAGYAGDKLGGGLAGIIALDPAEPEFHVTSPVVHIDNFSAKIVVVISTGLPWHVPPRHLKHGFGHITFHVNGGRKQPGCDMLDNRRRKRGIIPENVIVDLYCNHFRAPELLINSFNVDDCPFYGYECNSYDNFLKGNCIRTCKDKECYSLGIETLRIQPKNKFSSINLFLQTGESSPYCHFHYYVRVICGREVPKVWMYGRNTDKLYIKLHGSLRTTDYIKAYWLSIKYNSKSYIEFLVNFRNLGNIQKISLLLKKRWTMTDLISSDNSCQNYTYLNSCKITPIKNNYCERCPYFVKELFVLNLETGTKFNFKGDNKPLESSVSRTYLISSTEENVKDVHNAVPEYSKCERPKK